MLIHANVHLSYLHKLHVSLLLAMTMWNMGKFFVLESQIERFMYKEVPWNPPAEAGMCTMNWHLYIIEFIRAKTMFASCFSSKISLSMLTLMALTVHNKLAPIDSRGFTRKNDDCVTFLIRNKLIHA